MPLGLRAISSDALPRPDVPRTNLPALRGAGASAGQGSITTTCGIGILNTPAPVNKTMQRDDAAGNHEVLQVQTQATGQGLGHHLREQTNLLLYRLGDFSSWWRSSSKINYLSNGEMPMVTRHQGAEHREARSTRTSTSREDLPVEHGQCQGGMLQEQSRTSTSSSDSTWPRVGKECATMSAALPRQQGRAPESTSSSTTWTTRNGD